MADFPLTIPIDVQSSGDIDMGITAVEMEDGRPHVQSHHSSLDEQATYRVKHAHMNQADEDTVVSFLRTNIGFDFDLTDHSKQPVRKYTGKQISRGVTRRLSSGELVDLGWEFRGRRTL